MPQLELDQPAAAAVCEWCMAAPATTYVVGTRCCDGCKVNRATRVLMALQRWKPGAETRRAR